MELTAILEVVKAAPEGLALLAVVIVSLVSLFFKRADIDLTQVTSVSKLQTEQLKTLIEQNTALAEELHAVRKELSEAYKIINDMRMRITELENSYKRSPE